MSAPDTNTEKQKEVHKGPLRMGIAFPLLWGVGLLAIFVVVMFLRGGDPEGADEQVDGRTGDVEETEVEATE
jgi:hypothetical protein